MTEKNLFQKLSADFPKEAIEKAPASKTRGGYDATYIKSQYLVNRLNKTVGIYNWGTEILELDTYQKGKFWYCDLELKLFIHPDAGRSAERTAYGWGRNFQKTDAKKGAFTDAFKKVCALFSIGWKTYAGMLDEDSEGYMQQSSNSQATVKQPKQPAKKEKNQKSREDLQRYNTLKSLYFKGEEAKQAEKDWKKAVKEGSKTKEGALRTCLVFLQTAKQKKKSPDQVVTEVVEMTKKLKETK